MDSSQENFSLLPKEMYENIFSFLDSSSLKKCRLVSKGWKTMIDSSVAMHRPFAFRGLSAIFGRRYVSPFEKMTSFGSDKGRFYAREIAAFRNFVDQYDQSVSEIFLDNVDIRFERVFWELGLEGNPHSEDLFVRFVRERTLLVREISLDLGFFSKPFGEGLDGCLDGLQTLKIIQSGMEHFRRQYLSDFFPVAPAVSVLSLHLRGVGEIDLGLVLERFAEEGKLKHLLLQGSCLSLPTVPIQSLVELTVYNYNYVYSVGEFLRSNPWIKRINFIYKFRVFGHRTVNLGALLKSYEGKFEVLRIKGSYTKVRAEFYRVLAFREKFDRLILEVGLGDEFGRVIVDRKSCTLHGGSVLTSCMVVGLPGRL